MIILSGNPKSTSTLYMYHCKFGFPSGYMSAKGKELKKQYQDEMWKQRNSNIFNIVTTPLELQMKIYFSSKGKHDIDNFSKLVLDAGNGILWEDDGLINKMTIEKCYDKNLPRIELLLKLN